MNADTVAPPAYAQLFMEGAKEAGVSVVAALPESLLAGIYRECVRDNAIRYIQGTNEADLPGIVAGVYLGGKKALMVMENSGLRQGCEALARLSMLHGVPMVIVVSFRGELGERNFWGHNHAHTMVPILDALRIPYVFVSKLQDIKPSIKKAFHHTSSSQWPLALIFAGECVENPYEAD